MAAKGVVALTMLWLAKSTAAFDISLQDLSREEEKTIKHFLTDVEVESAMDSYNMLNTVLNQYRMVSAPRRSSRSRFQRDQEMTYVYDTDTNEETGEWGEWNVVGPCSRTCGGGVITEARECLGAPGSCAGPSKRYSSCNLNECPPYAEDFRQQQCSKFNSVPFERKLYEWIPYLKAPRKCELNCMPKGERFYYRHAKKVHKVLMFILMYDIIDLSSLVTR